MDETDYLTISERVTNDWKEKLEVLRSHHRNQSREQQAQHLEELRVLQEDLLKDITHFMSKVKDAVGEKDSDLPEEGIMDGCGEVNCLQEELQALSVPLTEVTDQQDVITNTSQLDSAGFTETDLLLPVLPDTSSIALSTRVEHPQESTIDTSFPSLKMYSMAYSNGTLTDPSVHTSPVAIASQALPNHREVRGQSKLLADVVTKLQDVVGIEGEPSRTSEVAKFDRHLQDLKMFYESEILALKKKLSTMEKGGSGKDLDDFAALTLNTAGELDSGKGSELDKKCDGGDRDLGVAEGELKPSQTQSSLNSTCYHSSEGGTGGKMLDEFCKRLQDQLEDYEM